MNIFNKPKDQKIGYGGTSAFGNDTGISSDSFRESRGNIAPRTEAEKTPSAEITQSAGATALSGDQVQPTPNVTVVNKDTVPLPATGRDQLSPNFVETPTAAEASHSDQAS